MRYKAIVLDGEKKAKAIAASVEQKTNEMSSQGYELVTVSATGTGKMILVFGTESIQVEKEDEGKQATSATAHEE